MAAHTELRGRSQQVRQVPRRRPGTAAQLGRTAREQRNRSLRRMLVVGAAEAGYSPGSDCAAARIKPLSFPLQRLQHRLRSGRGAAADRSTRIRGQLPLRKLTQYLHMRHVQLREAMHRHHVVLRHYAFTLRKPHFLHVSRGVTPSQQFRQRIGIAVDFHGITFAALATFVHHSCVLQMARRRGLTFGDIGSRSGVSMCTFRSHLVCLLCNVLCNEPPLPKLGVKSHPRNSSNLSRLLLIFGGRIDPGLPNPRVSIDAVMLPTKRSLRGRLHGPCDGISLTTRTCLCGLRTFRQSQVP